MKKLTFLALFFSFSTFTYAQLDAGQDQIICNIESAILSASYTPLSESTSDYALEEIALNMDPSNSGTNVTGLIDDTYTDVIDIGFDFCFYGNMFDRYGSVIFQTNNPNVEWDGRNMLPQMR